MSKSRRAPDGGYSFTEKATYREDVWKAISGMWGAGLRRQAAMILPSKEGAEIPVAIRWGAKESNLIGVDDNPAIIASAPWRTTHPGVAGVGSSLGRAAERLAKKGVKCGVANLDLCNKFSRDMVSELRRFAEADILSDTAVVAVTLLKGREHTETTAALSLMAEKCGMDWGHGSARAFVATLFLGEVLGDRAWVPIHSGEYQSGTKKMVYLVAATATKDSMLREAQARGWAPRVVLRGMESEYQCKTMAEVNRYFAKRYNWNARFKDGPVPDWHGVVEPEDRGNSKAKWRWGSHSGFGGDDTETLRRDLRDMFVSADNAVEFFDGSFVDESRPGYGPTRFVEGAWGAALERYKRKVAAARSAHHKDLSPVLPWTSEWRNAPPVHGTVTHPVSPLWAESVAEPPTLAASTEPFSTWEVNA